jgi:hypothetical protein
VTFSILVVMELLDARDLGTGSRRGAIPAGEVVLYLGGRARARTRRTCSGSFT